MSAIRRKFLSRNKWRTLALVFVGAFLGTGFILGSINIIGKLVSAAPTVPIPSISLTSQHTSFASNTPGSWNIEKSAKWTGTNTARITFDVEAIQKVHDNASYDILFVADVSGSMHGDKLAQVKSDASELTDNLLSSSDNRIALVSFESGAHIESGFTSDKALMLQKINALSDTGSTNYYDGLVKAEEVLEGYTKQPNRELILLFLTDGYPNTDTPNEVGQYELLKQKYPYMTINGIQYEMGDTVLDPIKAVSDNQFIASMTSLNNVLFEASVAPYVYDNFVLTDFIDDSYFTVGSINNISANKGTVNLTYDGDTPKITWDLSNALRTGNSARMTIDVALKDTYITIGGLYPTNKRTTVESVLDDTPTENIITTNTPVLKNSYNVTYEANSPSDCTVSGMPNPLSEEQFIFNTIEVSSAKPTCSGYNFAGYIITTSGVKKLNDDYFIMPEKDVTIRATWTKVSMEKSMDGTVYETKTAIFDSGYGLNSKLKQLAGQSGTTYNTANTNVTAFKRADLLSDTVDVNDSTYILSKANSQVPIYGWFDNSDGTLYYYTDAETVAGERFDYLFSRMESLTDISGLSDIDTSSLTHISYLFYGNSSLTDISVLANWDTSNLGYMNDIFYNATSLSNISALSGWDTSQVINMSGAFRNTAITNVSALANWDTSKVTTMGSMFYNDKSLTNISALANWDTSKLTNMTNMFSVTTSLTDISALSGWDTSQVTRMDGMFDNASSLANISALSGWDTSQVTDMSDMFSWTAITSASALANWDTSKVTNMTKMFYAAKSLADISGLANWNTSKVKNMSYLFYFTQNLANISALSGWITDSATDMSYMFYNTAIADVSALASWNTSNVTKMNYMFYGISTLTNISGLANWDTSKVTTMSNMFRATAFTNVSALTNWDTSKVTNMNHMFGNTAITNVSGLANWDTSSLTDMGGLFSMAESLTNISGLANWNTSQVTTMDSLFYGTKIANIDALSGWDTSVVTTMYGMFSENASLTNINGASSWSTSNVTTMKNMFMNDSSLTNISGVTNWNTSQVTTFEHMFDGTGISNVNALATWNTSSVTNMGTMFQHASSLSNISGLTNWDTSKVEGINYMFNDTNLSNISPLSGWDTSNVTNMSGTFSHTKLTNINALSSWNTGNVTNMSDMFSLVTTLTNISGASGWNTARLTNASRMFYNDTSIGNLTTLNNWNTSSLANKSDMFYGIPSSVTRPSWY